MSDDAFGPIVTVEPAATDDVFGPVVSSYERDIALKAFGPCVMSGRPSDYTEEKAEAILLALMSGETLERIDKDPELPCKKTIMRWVARYPEFRQSYFEALEYRTHVRCDEIIDIADNSTGDYTLEDAGGEDSVPVMAFRKNNVVRAKLQIDSRFKVMAAEHPKRYGINQPQQRPDPSAPALEAPRDPEDAKDITGSTRLIDVHPMTAQLEALKQQTPKPGA